jgi:GMP synthase (glutamine-hydrolysing)
LIARRIREMSVYSEILPCTQPVAEVLAGGYQGIILSGGPSSVYDDGAPLPDKALLESGIPILGICYGMQAMGYLLGGQVVPAERREYGPADLRLEGTGGLLDGITPERGNQITVWMSHGDTVLRPPAGFVSLASTANCPVAAMADAERRLYAVQFHPEVAHTPQGKTVLANFLRACGVKRDWSMTSFVDSAVERSARPSAATACSARSPVAWTRPWWPRWSTRPSAISSRASSWTTASSVPARPNTSSRRSVTRSRST